MTETAATPPLENPPAPLFVRPREGRMVAGVCAGIAERWQLDVTLVRIVAVVLTLVSGVGLAAYGAAWLLTPSVDGPAPLGADNNRWVRRLPALVLISLAALAAVSLAHALWFPIPVGLLVIALLVALVVGTRRGRWALVAIAALLAVAIATVGSFGSHLGTRTYQVASVDDLRSSYDFGVGTIKLDLSQLGSVSGAHRTEVRLGRGDVTVTVPPGVPVLVHARAGLGSVTVNGHRTSGVDAEQSTQVGAATATSADRLVLDVVVGAGTVTVR